MNKQINNFIENAIKQTDLIGLQRSLHLNQLSDYIYSHIKNAKELNLVFICTHNSRRSHFAQIWAQVAVHYFNLSRINTFSAGTEITELNQRVIESLKRSGFNINTDSTKSSNKQYKIQYGTEFEPIIAFSKDINDSTLPKSNFAAIMTCSHADSNCPVILGCDLRFPLNYNDPKDFDDTDLEATKYDETSLLIASEIFYIFQNALR